MESGSSDLTTMVAGLGCADIVDAMGRLHQHRAHIVGMTSPTPGRVLFGPAATITFLPYRDDFTEAAALGFAGWFYRAVGPDPRGLVLVLSSGGYPEVSHGGGTKLSRVDNHALAGVLADGRLRDFNELAGYRFATWCRGEATRWGGDTVLPCAANLPVEVGGVTVAPGDFVFADRSGAVVIPAPSVRDVLAEARRVQADDQRFLAEIRTEDPAALARGGHQSEQR